MLQIHTYYESTDLGDQKLDLSSCITHVTYLERNRILRHCAYVYIEIAAKIMGKKDIYNQNFYSQILSLFASS